MALAINDLGIFATQSVVLQLLNLTYTGDKEVKFRHSLLTNSIRLLLSSPRDAPGGGPFRKAD